MSAIRKVATRTYKKLIVKTVSSNFKQATQVVSVNMLKPGPHEVLIKNKFVGVNASDVNAANGKYFTKIYPPFDIGLEGVGEVVEIGDKVTEMSVGQPVAHMGLRAYAEYNCLPTKEVIPLPDLTPEFLALLVSGLTASISLDKQGQIRPKEKVLITTAAGGTGHLAVQWAKHIGCHVIGTCSTDDKVELLKSLGCDRSINYQKENLSEVLKKEYPEGLDVVWESVGGQMFLILSSHLANRGRLLSVGTISGYRTETPIPIVNVDSFPARILLNSLSLSGFMLFHFMEHIPAYLAMMVTLQQQGKLKIILDQGKTTPEGEFLGIESIPRAVEYLHQGRNHGKVLVRLY